MMVPRSQLAYRYSSSPPRDVHTDGRSGGRRTVKKSTPPKTERPVSPVRTVTEPVKPASSKPVAVPKPERSHSSAAQIMPSRNRKTASRGIGRSPTPHDSNALPPAVAALLAMTSIPPPRPNQFRRQSREQRRVSIDELVNEWKSDDTFKASYSSSPALSVLLEDASDTEESYGASQDTSTDGGFLHTRSASSDSVPSLEADDRSVLSLGSVSTPESLRSRKSSGNLRRDKARWMTAREESSQDHPLVPLAPTDEDDDLLVSAPSSRSSTPKPRSSFTSNLTISLRAIKRSIASFSLSNSASPSQRSTSPQFSDEILWSHPFLFPQFSTEVRPTIEGTPTKAQRRYLNPVPLSFEDQEAPFQQALHAPYLAEQIDEMPTIQMQTYNRGKRKAGPKRAGPDPNSEAGRALLAASSVRQREARENSDFLRVVVLEMNMRREGKLETGRARIWLPPRQESAPNEGSTRVPQRWVGVSAY